MQFVARRPLLKSIASALGHLRLNYLLKVSFRRVELRTLIIGYASHIVC